MPPEEWDLEVSHGMFAMVEGCCRYQVLPLVAQINVLKGFTWRCDRPRLPQNLYGRIVPGSDDADVDGVSNYDAFKRGTDPCAQ